MNDVAFIRRLNEMVVSNVGYQLADSVHQIRPDLKVLILSGFQAVSNSELNAGDVHNWNADKNRLRPKNGDGESGKCWMR